VFRSVTFNGKFSLPSLLTPLPNIKGELGFTVVFGVNVKYDWSIED
jgi:hypothetical protein